MRSIPRARTSRFHRFRRLLDALHNCVTLKRMKRRWNLHKLKKCSRSNNLRSAVPIDRVANLQTGMSNKSSNMKPLLLISFNKGQQHSPKVRILENNGQIRSWISGRKFTLKRIVNNASVERDMENAQRHTVRQEVAKRADLKVNYSQQGVLKSVDIPMLYADDPKLINIGQDRTLRIRDYPSLNPTHRNTRMSISKAGQPQESVSNFFFQEAVDS